MSTAAKIQAHRDALTANASRLDSLRRLHEDVLRQLEALPSPAAEQLLARAAQTITLWERNRTCSPNYIRMWRQLLEQPSVLFRSQLLSGGDYSNALMQNTPFGFLLHSKS